MRSAAHQHSCEWPMPAVVYDRGVNNFQILCGKECQKYNWLTPVQYGNDAIFWYHFQYSEKLWVKNWENIVSSNFHSFYFKSMRDMKTWHMSNVYGDWYFDTI